MQNETCTFRVHISKSFHITFRVINEEGERELPTSEYDSEWLDEIVHYFLTIDQHYFYRTVSEKDQEIIQIIKEKHEKISGFLSYIKSMVEEIKSYIIDETIIELPTENYFRIQMIKELFQSVGFQNILLNGEIEYSMRRNYLSVISDQIDHQNSISQLNQLYENDIQFINQCSNENEIVVYKNKLTKQCLLKTCHYFQSKTDYINFECVTKRFRGILCQLKFNPISLGKKCYSFFHK